MDYKTIGLGTIITTILTIVLSIIFFPLFLLSPVIGGFFAAYLSEGYEDYDEMDKIDGAVLGGISGLIGGSVIGILYFMGFGVIGAIIGAASDEIGTMVSIVLITGLVVFKFLGIIGGIIGVILKE